MFNLFITTPEKVIYNGDARSIIAPGSAGYLQILHNHAPIIASLTVGKLTVMDNEGTKIYALSGGFLEVSKNKAVILADTIELQTDIDFERAKNALKRAKDHLAENHETDRQRALEAKQRAENRIKIKNLPQANKESVKEEE